MIEKVNTSHPDKLADRIAGAIEVLIGHRQCHVVIETSSPLVPYDIIKIVHRIGGNVQTDIRLVPQDTHLAANQRVGLRCGDNGIFKGMPLPREQKQLSDIAHQIYAKYPADGKYILDGDRLIICQSNASSAELRREHPGAEINPLGDWTGGTDTDTGATNRKLGSDMADSVTGGGIHGKDLSKADVSANIYAFLKAQKTGQPVELCCAIGDTEIDGIPYPEIVAVARDYIQSVGGFEKLAEWGLF